MDTSTNPDDDLERLWAAHRGRVVDVAYRITANVADAEDVAQEAYLRLVVADRASLEDAEAWLVTVASRLCLDRLRAHERSRRAYVGPWLPDPLLDVVDPGPDLADRITLDESVRMALLVVLQRLTPAERTSFVLHDVFGMDFRSVAEVVGRSPDACRQLASRARRHVENEGSPRMAVAEGEHRRIAERFARACEDGDFEGLVSVLDPGVEGDFDSGGVVPGAPLGPLRGRDAVASQLLSALAGTRARAEVADLNGAPGVLVVLDDTAVASISLVLSDAGLVVAVLAVGNPEKLGHLNRQRARSG